MEMVERDAVTCCSTPKWTLEDGLGYFRLMRENKIRPNVFVTFQFLFSCMMYPLSNSQKKNILL